MRIAEKSVSQKIYCKMEDSYKIWGKNQKIQPANISLEIFNSPPDMFKKNAGLNDI